MELCENQTHFTGCSVPALHHRTGPALYNMSGHWDAAGAMFRKAFESALKSKFPALSGTLFSCIQEAERQQQLDSNLVEWAHQIRMDGNEAVHGDEPRTKKKMQNS